MIAYLYSFIVSKVLGFHKHDWSKWKVIEATSRNAEFTMQIRRCESCGKMQSSNI